MVSVGALNTKLSHIAGRRFWEAVSSVLGARLIQRAHDGLVELLRMSCLILHCGQAFKMLSLLFQLFLLSFKVLASLHSVSPDLLNLAKQLVGLLEDRVELNVITLLVRHLLLKLVRVLLQIVEPEVVIVLLLFIRSLIVGLLFGVSLGLRLFKVWLEKLAQRS